MSVPLPRLKLDARLPGVVHLKEGDSMSVIVTIPDPLATKVEAAAKSHATSLEQYVIEAVAKTVAEENGSPSTASDDRDDPVFGLFADDADLLDEIVEEALQLRRTMPARAPHE